MRRFLFLLGSTRQAGNSEGLARRAAQALPPTDEQRWLRLIDHPLPPFFDTRHSTGFTALDGNIRLLCDATLAATDLVIVTPVYWYSVAWPIKLYLDHWTGWMRRPELAFGATLAGRSLWAVLADADDEAQGSASPAIDMLRRTADYMTMRWRGALLGHANGPGEIERRDGARRGGDLLRDAVSLAGHIRPMMASPADREVTVGATWTVDRLDVRRMKPVIPETAAVMTKAVSRVS